MIYIHSTDTFLPIKAKEQRIIDCIETEIYNHNIDNISRTKAYFDYYEVHPDICWSFLAHMVSRNAGWNMCDLEGNWFPKIINERKRYRFFLTYERANWLIFQDAYPQLLLYHYSTKMGKPMFHLLKYFHVSRFMEKEWNSYWNHKDSKRLMISLITNEQNIIQRPVIEHPLYRRRVFQSPLYSFQDWLHFSSVLFPTLDGELYGASVNGFRSVHKRIDLGKRLASILFSQELYLRFYEFARETVHTGSRHDYEQYFCPVPVKNTPNLRAVYPIINHTIDRFEDWSTRTGISIKWFSTPVRHPHPILVTRWYKKKQHQLRRIILLKERFSVQKKVMAK